jgi:GH35 family endo-1,4-beta-xylanase
MKTFKKIVSVIAAFILFFSCSDEDTYNFSVDKPASIAAMEYVNKYDALKTYVDRTSNPNFKLGAGVSLSDYINKGVFYQLVNSNFNEITLGYEMKHGAVLQSNGKLNPDNIDNLLKMASDAGISVFGHTLVWHSNQNASYLNGLLTPLIVTEPPFANNLDLSGLKDASLNGWGLANKGAGISVLNNAGMKDAQGIKLVSGANASKAEDLSLTTPDIPVVIGHTYEVVFYIKSDSPGEGRISFEGLTNNTPSMDWTNTGEITETFQTSKSWQEVKFKIKDFESNSLKINFDLGYKSNVTYYMDVNNMYVYDTQGEPLVLNLVANGNFETGNIDNWGRWGDNILSITEKGTGAGGSDHALSVYTASKSANYWDEQIYYTLSSPLGRSISYTLGFWCKSDKSGNLIQPEVQGKNYSADGFGAIEVTTEWTYVEKKLTTTKDDRNLLVISFGDSEGHVDLDNIVLRTTEATGSSSITVERTAKEKTDIIESALLKWMSGMLTNCKPYVKAWDVVNEPMDDGNPSELKTGIGKSNLSADEFYWQDYLGKEYAVKAFKLARQYGNQDDKLFINDYNLEYSLDKCKGLIQYVEYIESQGVKVDGIGTQMHISIDSDKEKIAEMFRLLAATGKLIKISELDMGLGAGVTAQTATEEQYLVQSEMYEYVIKKYMEIIPVAQRYGITMWSPLDSPENSSWRAGEPIGLWNLGYDRKHAYAGFANGLAGKVIVTE